jgi:hypothetical protein
MKKSHLIKLIEEQIKEIKFIGKIIAPNRC